MFSRFFRKFLFENNLNFQKSCKNKNCTKNTYITFARIHLLTFYPICFVICSLSLHVCMWILFPPKLFEGKLHTSWSLLKKNYIFWCGPFLKSLLNLLQYCFCFTFCLFFLLWGMWDHWPGIEWHPVHWKVKSSTWLPGKSPHKSWSFIIHTSMCMSRELGEGTGNPLQYSCLENSMDRGAWWATVVHRVAKSETWLSD